MFFITKVILSFFAIILWTTIPSMAGDEGFCAGTTISSSLLNKRIDNLLKRTPPPTTPSPGSSGRLPRVLGGSSSGLGDQISSVRRGVENLQTPVVPSSRETVGGLPTANRFVPRAVGSRQSGGSSVRSGFGPPQVRQLASSTSSVERKKISQAFKALNIPHNPKTLAIDEKALKKNAQKPGKKQPKVSLEQIKGLIAEAVEGDKKKKKKKKRVGPDGSSYSAAKKLLTSLGEIEKVKENKAPNDYLYKILQNFSEIERNGRWTIRSRAPSSIASGERQKVFHFKDRYGSEVHFSQMTNQRGDVTGVKVMKRQRDTSKWSPSFYKRNPLTDEMKYTTIYHGKKLPFACVGCHGNSPKKLRPQFSPKKFSKHK